MSAQKSYEVQYSTSYSGPPGPYNEYNAPPPGHTVVVTQPMAQARPQLREWNTDVFDCFSDMKICLCGWCCTLCLACQVSEDLGESMAIPCCVPGWLTVLRTKFRTQQGISGTVMGDCCCAEFCGYCTLCQLKREIETCKSNGTLNNQN